MYDLPVSIELYSVARVVAFCILYMLHIQLKTKNKNFFFCFITRKVNDNTNNSFSNNSTAKFNFEYIEMQIFVVQ